jgi:hypothetical protein
MDAALRQFVASRADGRCEYCRLPQYAVYLPFHVEHIVARQHDGTDDAENLALACDRCNRHKGPNLSSIDPESGALVRLFRPRQDAWNEHFSISGAEIVGLTDIGRASVRLLRMNTEHRVELRQHLIERGEF